MKEIANTLSHLFKRHRVVFGYDGKQELWTEFGVLRAAMPAALAKASRFVWRDVI